VSPVAISADKRFHRAHVKPARKRSRLRTISAPLVKGGLIAAFVLLLIYRGGAVVAEAPLLNIDHIVVAGNHRLATEDVLSALNGLRGENIVSTDLDARNIAGAITVSTATSAPGRLTVEVVVAERADWHRTGEGAALWSTSVEQ
jgi:cell division septal protein FtsQ